MTFQRLISVLIATTVVSLGQSVIQYTAVDTSSSGSNSSLKLVATLSQSGSASYTDLQINRTEASLGSGNQFFESFQVGGNNRWVVDHTGTVAVGTWAGSVISIAYGGTGQSNPTAGFNALSPMNGVGDLIYGGNNGSGAKLSGNTASAKMFLSETGTGAAGAAPVWSSINSSDLPSATASEKGAVTVDGTTITVRDGVISALPPVAQLSATYYVSTNGSDKVGSGSEANPWQTVQYAWDQIKCSTYARNATVTLFLSEGTYDGAMIDRPTGGTIILTGDPNFPGSVTINNIVYCFGAILQIQNLKLAGLYATNGGRIIVGPHLNFTTTSSHHIQAGYSGEVWITNNYTISGSANRHISIDDFGCVVYGNSITVNLIGTPAFSEAFCITNHLSVVRFHSYSSRVTWSGAATGQRYMMQTNSMIDTMGGGASYLPGSSSGTISTGGVYY